MNQEKESFDNKFKRLINIINKDQDNSEIIKQVGNLDNTTKESLYWSIQNLIAADQRISKLMINIQKLGVKVNEADSNLIEILNRLQYTTIKKNLVSVGSPKVAEFIDKLLESIKKKAITLAELQQLTQ